MQTGSLHVRAQIRPLPYHSRDQCRPKDGQFCREYLGVRHLRKGSAGESSKPMPSKIRRGMAFEEVLNPRASSPDLHEAQSCRPVEHEPLRSLSVTDNSSYIHSDPNIELR